VQNAIDMRGREAHVGLCAVGEVGAAAGLDNGHIGIHDEVSGAGELLDAGAAGAVVVVGVADEQNLDVAEVKAEGLNALLDERHRTFKTGVDEDGALGRDDEIGGQTFAAHIVEVAGDAKGRKSPCPGGVGGSGERQSGGQAAQQGDGQ